MLKEVWVPLTINKTNEDQFEKAKFVLPKHPKIRNVVIGKDVITYEHQTMVNVDD